MWIRKNPHAVQENAANADPIREMSARGAQNLLLGKHCDFQRVAHPHATSGLIAVADGIDSASVGEDLEIFERYHFAHAYPLLAIELGELHVVEGIVIVWRIVNLHAVQNERWREVLQIGRLPEQICPGEIVAA